MAGSLSSKNSNSMMSTMKSFVGDKSRISMVVFALLVVVFAVAFYYIYQSNNVDNFENAGVDLEPKDDEIKVVLFYAPWCGHCKTFKPVFMEAKDTMSKNKTKSGKYLTFEMVDCDAMPEVGKDYGIAGYPTVKIITMKDGKKKVEEYDGDRTLEAMKTQLLAM